MIAVTDKATDNGPKRVFGEGAESWELGVGRWELGAAKFSLLSVLISQIAFANVIYSIHLPG